MIKHRVEFRKISEILQRTETEASSVPLRSAGGPVLALTLITQSPIKFAPLCWSLSAEIVNWIVLAVVEAVAVSRPVASTVPVRFSVTGF